MFSESAADSWGAGPALWVLSRDVTSDSDARLIPIGPLPPGKTMTFEPGQSIRYDYTLQFKPVGEDSVPELVPGRFVVRGQWNTIGRPWSRDRGHPVSRVATSAPNELRRGTGDMPTGPLLPRVRGRAIALCLVDAQ